MFLHPASLFTAPMGLLDEDFLMADLLNPMAGALPPQPRACRAAACAVPAARPVAYRLHRQPSFAPPAEPEVYLKRTSEGVLAACPLGRAFSRADIR